MLPAMFAACTNEVFEQVQTAAPDDSVLDGRTKGEVTLVVDRSNTEDADTRLEGSQNGMGVEWSWTGEEDKIGGVVVDYGEDDAIVGYPAYPHYAITNYPFTPVEIWGEFNNKANFRTSSAVVNGAYMFYSQYDGDATERRTISHKMTRLQNVDAGWEAGLKQVGSGEYVNSKGEKTKGQNFFVSPIVNLAISHGEDIQRPLSLTSAHAMLHIQFSSDLEEKYYQKGLKINKVVVEALGEDSEFKLAQTLNPFLIANLQKGLAAGERKAWFEANGAIKGMAETAIKANDAVITAIRDTKAVSEISVYSDRSEDATKDLVYQLNEPFVFDDDKDVFDLLVVFPEGKYKLKSGLKEIKGKTAGALLLTIYTSEGTYSEYISTSKDLVAARSQKLNIRNRKFVIKPGETNVDMHDPYAGLKVESTEDWNFTIDYIKEHARDFSEGGAWKAPVVELNDNPDITVDAEHFFPEFPVKYVGAANLSLEGQEAYTIDLNNVLLADDDQKPTIKVLGNANKAATLDIISKKNGDKTEKAVLKLESDATININEGQEVDFPVLVSNTALNLGKKAVVTATAPTTKGEVELNEGAKLTTTGTYTNTAVTNVAKEAVLTTATYKNSGAVTVVSGGKVAAATATNDAKGSFSISGELTATTFTNNGEIVVNGDVETPMNDEARGITTVKTLTNNGTITLTKGGDKKGNKGSLLEVTAKLTNNNIVNNNGDLQIKNLANSGTINIMDDPYAFIAVESGAATDAAGKGSIVLQAPVNYEKFNDFTTQSNRLINNDKVIAGVIETTLDQATYDKVFANWQESKFANQERAWNVLNKITVNGELKLKADGADKKDFVLVDGAAINSEKIALTINSLVANGTTELKGAALKTANITVKGTVTIAADATLTNNIALLIQSVDAKALNIEGTLNNKGKLNATLGKKVPLNTAVKGTLNNLGQIGTAAKSPVYFGGTELAMINAINKAYINFKTEWKVYKVSGTSWNSSYADENILEQKKRTWTEFINYLKAIQRKGDTGHESVVHDGKNCYFVELADGSGQKKTIGMENPSEIFGGNESAWKFVSTNFKPSIVDAYGTELLYNKGNQDAYTEIKKNERIKEFGHIQDYIYIAKNEGSVILDNENAKAYGYIKDNTNGIKKGEFTEDYKVQLEGENN